MRSLWTFCIERHKNVSQTLAVCVLPNRALCVRNHVNIMITYLFPLAVVMMLAVGEGRWLVVTLFELAYNFTIMVLAIFESFSRFSPHTRVWRDIVFFMGNTQLERLGSGLHFSLEIQTGVCDMEIKTRTNSQCGQKFEKTSQCGQKLEQIPMWTSLHNVATPAFFTCSGHWIHVSVPTLPPVLKAKCILF